MNIFSSFLLITSYISVVYADPFFRNDEYCDNPKPRIPTTQSISERKCFEYNSAVCFAAPQSVTKLSAISRSQTVLLDGCGSKETKLISGGENAGPKEFPHMALLGEVVRSNEQPDWVCGGSLISDQFILTAAHCFIRKINVVRLGELDYNRDDDEASPHEYFIKEIIIFPKFKQSPLTHDIALVKVAGKVEFNIYRRPACLPSSSTITDEQALATGWGYTSYSQNNRLSRLQKVLLNIYDTSDCERFITYNQICAGSKDDNRDTCGSDSGGPLQVFQGKEFYCMFRIIGIVAHGEACGFNVPAAYTRVYPYIDWIEQNVWGN